MRDLLIDLQEKDGANAGELGARKRSALRQPGRPAGLDLPGVLTLEVYYRHLPLYKRDSSGLAELER